MGFYISLAALLTMTAYVSGQGTFLPLQRVSTLDTTPNFLVGVSRDSRSAFKKVASRNNVTKWTQTVDGIPVYGSVLTTHGDEQGVIKTVQGFASRSVGLVDTRPEIPEEEAVRTLRAQWNHTSPVEEVTVRLDEPELQVLHTGDGFDKLIYKISYFIDWAKPGVHREQDGVIPAYINGLVDAHTGEIVRSWDGLQHGQVRAILGNKNIGQQFVDIDVEQTGRYSCKHRDAKRRVEVYDIWNKRQVTEHTTSRFTCDRADDEDWDLLSWTGAYSPRNEVFHHATQFVDLWNQLMGDAPQPYRTENSFLTFYVHYDYSYENAFFQGTAFYFGDGKDIFYPLTSLDIVCHEIGHAVTAWHGGNMEYHKQSGGMNEAYSDILGETCDMHYKKRSDYLIGSDIMRPGNWLGKSMRNMCDPKTLGSLDHMDQFNDRIGVHSSSGIYNKAWCTLSKTTGWDYIKAFEVFTDANLMYWNPTSTMHCGACGVETAAEDRGYRKSDVTAAFSVVGVSCGKC